MTLKSKFIEFSIRYLWVDIIMVLVVSAVFTNSPPVDLQNRLVAAIGLSTIIVLSLIGWFYSGRTESDNKTSQRSTK